MSRVAWWALLAVAACGGDAAKQPAPAPAQPAEVVADSLALAAPHGVEVWFTSWRRAADSAGRPCLERVMEIRREGKRIPVPLLYTGERPSLVGDSAIDAHIWLHCKPGNLYRVNLRTGFPLRIK